MWLQLGKESGRLNIKNRICDETLYNSFRLAGIDDGMRRQQQWQKPRKRRTKQ